MSDKKWEEPSEEMTVDLDLEDGIVTCEVVTIFTVDDKDYIALYPIQDEKDGQSGEVWIYGYSENPDDPDEEPELRYIDDEEEYEAAADAFDEYLDDLEFEEDPS